MVQLLDMLAQCQSVAIDLGNFIEQMKGEENLSAKACVAALEEYCEKIFDVYNNLPLAVGREKEDFQKLCAALNQAFVQMKQTVENEIIHKKLVAFLPDNPKRWKEMQALYDYYRQQENTEVCAVCQKSIWRDCGRAGRIR